MYTNIPLIRMNQSFLTNERWLQSSGSADNLILFICEQTENLILHVTVVYVEIDMKYEHPEGPGLTPPKEWCHNSV